MPEIHRRLDLKTIAATAIAELTHLRNFYRRAKLSLRDPHDRIAFEIAADAHDEALEELAQVGLDTSRLDEVARPIHLFDYAALEDQIREHPIADVAPIIEHRQEAALHLLECLMTDHPTEAIRRTVTQQRDHLHPCAEMLRVLAMPQAA